jgi:hypothetical protein
MRLKFILQNISNRADLKAPSSLKAESNTSPQRIPSFSTGGATRQIVALASPAAAAAIDASSNLAEQRR